VDRVSHLLEGPSFWITNRVVRRTRRCYTVVTGETAVGVLPNQ